MSSTISILCTLEDGLISRNIPSFKVKYLWNVNLVSLIFFPWLKMFHLDPRHRLLELRRVVDVVYSIMWVAYFPLYERLRELIIDLQYWTVANCYGCNQFQLWRDNLMCLKSCALKGLFFFTRLVPCDKRDLEWNTSAGQDEVGSARKSRFRKSK
jgi:hypothetical protein